MLSRLRDFLCLVGHEERIVPRHRQRNTSPWASSSLLHQRGTGKAPHGRHKSTPFSSHSPEPCPPPPCVRRLHEPRMCHHFLGSLALYRRLWVAPLSQLEGERMCGLGTTCFLSESVIILFRFIILTGLRHSPFLLASFPFVLEAFPIPVCVWALRLKQGDTKQTR